MSKFRLLIISPFDKCTVVLSEYESEVLMAAGEELMRKNPGIQFGIADEQGYFIWPEELKTTNKSKLEVFDINYKLKVTPLPPNCLECPMENCRLPYSKVLPNRRLTDFAYKRHPKCDLADSRKSNSKH